MPRSLDVESRGHFFDDPFFRDSWAEWDVMVGRDPLAERLRDTLSRKREEHRTRQQQGPVRVLEKDGFFQVVMDVREFGPRDLQVRAVEERIVVEGRMQQESGGPKTFVSEFSFPPEADIEQVTTALSKDGVLTIRAPALAPPLPKQSSAPGKPDIVYTGSESDTSDVGSNRSFRTTSSNTSSFKNSSLRRPSEKEVQGSSSHESCDSGTESISREMRDRLTINDPSASSLSNSNSSCSSSSPVPSEFSDVSKQSTSSELNQSRASKEPTTARKLVNEPAYRVSSPSQQSSSSSLSGRSSRISDEGHTPRFMSTMSKLPTFTAGCGSSGDTSITVEEKDGNRTVTSEKTNVVLGTDGTMESKEISAQMDGKDSQAARREALTRITRATEDPEGRFKEAEKAQAQDVSEMCVKTLPDGSKMTIKKSSTSTSSHKSFTSNNIAGSLLDDPFFKDRPLTNFDDMKSMMGRGHSLRSQMSTDSLGSSRSENSRFSEEKRYQTSSNTLPKTDTGFNRSETERNRTESRTSEHDSFRDADSFFSRNSNLSNRPSLSQRFPEFASAFDDFDDKFADFPSMRNGSAFSKSTRDKDSFDSFFNRKL